MTICIQNRACLLGEVINSEMQTSDYGRIVEEEWRRTADLRQEAALDVFQVMPNHFHGIIFISGTTPGVGAHGCAPTALTLGLKPGSPAKPHGRAPSSLSRPPKSLGSLIAGFKSISAKRINELRGTAGALIWQRGYHDRVIRNERELNAMRQYILDNPPNWDLDSENPASPGRKPGML